MSRRVTAVALALAAAVLLAACGISADSGPRDIGQDERPDLPTSTQVNQPKAGPGPRVYMLAPQVAGEAPRLRAVSRDVTADPAALVTALLAGLSTEDQANRLRTAIPAGTALRSARRASNGVVVVDVTGDLLQATGDSLIDAVSQIVFTVSELDGVAGVRLLADGATRDWPRGDGSSSNGVLTTFDYPGRDPTTQPDYPAVPTPAAATTSTT